MSAAPSQRRLLPPGFRRTSRRNDEPRPASPEKHDDLTTVDRYSLTKVGGPVQTGAVEGEVMFDAKFKLAAASLIRAAMVEDFETAELIISQHDPYELTRAMAVISAQGWTITNGYNMARAVESLDVLASVFAEEAGVDRREPPR
jgi:hypothetical protein